MHLSSHENKISSNDINHNIQYICKVFFTVRSNSNKSRKKWLNVLFWIVHFCLESRVCYCLQVPLPYFTIGETSSLLLGLLVKKVYYVQAHFRPVFFTFTELRFGYFCSIKGFVNHWSKNTSLIVVMSLKAIFKAPLMSAWSWASHTWQITKAWKGRCVSNEPYLLQRRLVHCSGIVSIETQ